MRLLALYSGGKDSTLAIDKALEGSHEVVALVTAKPSRIDSWMFHTIALSVVPLQAESMGIPHRYVTVSGEKECEVDELARELRFLVEEFEIDGLLTGAIASSYQKARVDRVAEELGLAHIAPNWGMAALDVLREALRRGYKVIVSAVSALGLGERWLGREIDEVALKELEDAATKYGLNPAGEGGEMETLVLDCRLFRSRIEVEYRRVWEGDRGYIELERVRLVGKA